MGELKYFRDNFMTKDRKNNLQVVSNTDSPGVNYIR